MINKNALFECKSCENEFEIIAHSDFEDTDVNYCPLCGDMVELEPDLDDFLEEDGGE